MEEFRIQSPVGIVGYAFPEHSFRAGLTLQPDVVVGDGGSTDPGPYYLGSGNAHVSRAAVHRDLELMLVGARERQIPLIIGSAGTAGGAPHVQWTLDIILDIARRHGLSFNLGVIQSEQDPNYLVRLLERGRIKPLGPGPRVSAERMLGSQRIVGMMGAEPIMRALEAGADVILCGRSSDAAIFAAMPLLHGFSAGPAWHLAKILECGSAAAIPKRGSDGLFGYLHEDGFVVEPTNPEMRCVPIRVAAHSLYENASPYLLTEPSGVLDISNARYEQVGHRQVRVTGSRFIEADRYTVKLEGAELVGSRSFTIVGVRDPMLIEQLDGYLDRIQNDVASRNLAPVGDYRISFHQYGRNAVMGPIDPLPDQLPNEIGLLVDVVGKTQDQASAILALTRTFLQVSDFEGRLCTSGNIAYPFSPNGFDAGPVYRFNLWHVAEPDDPLEMFPIQYLDVDGTQRGNTAMPSAVGGPRRA